MWRRNLILIILLSTIVHALQPTQEQICCLDAELEEGNYDFKAMPEYCSGYNLDFDRCQTVIKQWEQVLEDYTPDPTGTPPTPEVLCCIESKDETGYNEELLIQNCPDLVLVPKACEQLFRGNLPDPYPEGEEDIENNYTLYYVLGGLVFIIVAIYILKKK